MAQFSNTQHVTIQGARFNSAQGDIHINNLNRDSESGLHALSLVISHGAIHDSAERYPPPNCHPDTRKAVRQIILDWSHDNSALPFFWLYGPAGSGKTAILQAIAEVMCGSSERDQLGGTFFFSRGKCGRDQGHFLFSTIAYQLALNVPGLRQHINHIMEANPSLHTKSIAIQLQTLIVDPLQSLSPPPQRSYLFIIDGLDECQDKATQHLILRLLCETITARKLPLRFLIGSRPEPHIRTCFDQKPLYTLTQRVVLDETFSPGRDIRVFLKDGFANICAKHADILSHVKQPWPPEGIIDLLVQRSSGQFIYAATVLKFVDADFCSPTKQLALVLKPNPMAFSDLDQLYTQILSAYPSRADVVQVLGIIVAFDSRTLTSDVIEDVLGMEEGGVKLVLRGLSSLIAFVGDENEEYLPYPTTKRVGGVYLIHASFRDYLVDSSRSGPFHVDEQDYKNWTTIWSFALINKSIGRSWRIPTATRLPHSKTLDFIKSYLPYCFIVAPELVKDAIMADINNLVQEFWKISSDRVVDVCFAAMHCLMEIFEHMGYSVSYRFRDISGTRPEVESADERLRILYRYQNMAHHCLISAICKSSDMADLLRLLPGVAVQNGLTIQGMADLYGVKVDLLERLSKWTIKPFSKLEPSNLCSRSCYVLERYLSDFLRDREQSHLYYCDPMLHHVLICRRFLSLATKSNFFDAQCHDLAGYFQSNLYQHLCAATEIFHSGDNIPANHPAVEILNDLDKSTFYHFDATRSRFKSNLAPYTIRPVLRWVDMLNSRLKGATVSIPSVNLIKRLGRLTDRIYREILCIEMHGSIRTVTICAPLRTVSMSLETQPCKTANTGVLSLSWDLLAQESVAGRISSSFTDFMTTPERSGALYISRNVYHTRITEYSLETNFRYNNNSSSSPFSPLGANDIYLELDWSFEEHISHALPTEMIIYLLGSIYFLQPTSQYILSTSSMINSLKVIMKWLEGLESERPHDLYHHLRVQLHQGKLPLKKKGNPRAHCQLHNNRSCDVNGVYSSDQIVGTCSVRKCRTAKNRLIKNIFHRGGFSRKND